MTTTIPAPSAYELQMLRQAERAVRSLSQILVAESAPEISAALKKEANFSVWSEGLIDEVSFWWAEIGARADGYRSFARDLAERVIPFQYEPLVSHFGDQTIHVLDVGSGPFTTLGTGWAEREVSFSLADPLAGVYRKLLEMFRIPWPFESHTCAGEHLTETFPRDHFHFVLARNALDHSIHPLICIRQMLEVARPGGVALIRHFENEGHNGQYTGLHQWNFSEENGRAVIWNRTEKLFLDHELPPDNRITVRKETDIPRDGHDWTDNWIEIVIQKAQ